MNELVSRNIIEHKVISFYTSVNVGKNSFVRFGGYCINDMGFDADISYIRTMDKNTWATKLQNVVLNYMPIDFKGDRKAMIEPSLSYNYIPK